MKKMYFILCFFCMALLPASFALAKDKDITVPVTTVATYKGGEYGDGYWLLFEQGGEILALYSPDMVIKELQGQEGKTVQVQYEYSMSFHPKMGDYIVMKTFKNFKMLPHITSQQLLNLEEKLLADKGPKQALLDVGAYYHYGLRGIKADATKALEWYKKIAAFGIPEALIRAGDILMLPNGPLFSHYEAHTMYTEAAKAGYTPAFTRLGDLSLVFGMDSAEIHAQNKEEKEERKQWALTLYTFAAKQKDIDAEARLIAMDLPPILEGFIPPQGPCPDKYLGKVTIQGRYMENTSHNDVWGGYFGFLVHANDGNSYDIGMGHDYPTEFEGIKPGNTITIPFYKKQGLDTKTGLCVVKFFHDEKSKIKGSYIQ